MIICLIKLGEAVFMKDFDQIQTNFSIEIVKFWLKLKERNTIKITPAASLNKKVQNSNYINPSDSISNFLHQKTLSKLQYNLETHFHILLGIIYRSLSNTNIINLKTLTRKRIKSFLFIMIKFFFSSLFYAFISQ